MLVAKETQSGLQIDYRAVLFK